MTFTLSGPVTVLQIYCAECRRHLAKYEAVKYDGLHFMDDPVQYAVVTHCNERLPGDSL